MKRLLLSTAIVGMMGTAAVAQNASTTAPAGDNPYVGEQVTDAIYASQFIGKSVYVAENDVGDTPMTAASTDWQNVGEVNDIVIGRDGQVNAVLVDVGGFLGLGERTVAVDMSAMRLVTDSDTAGDYFIVFRSTRAALEAAPQYDFPETMASTSVAPAGTNIVAGAENTANRVGTAAGEMAAATGAAVGTAGATMRGWMNPTEGYASVDHAGLTVEQIQGATVYDAKNDRVGSIAELKMGTGGQIEQAVVDVGGFLGIGAKPVALSFSDLDIHKQVDGNTYRVYVNMTKEQLEALPAHSDS